MQTFEIIVWDGTRSKGTRVHVGTEGPNGKALCGYVCSERTEFRATGGNLSDVGCMTCSKKAETLICRRADAFV